MRVLVFCALLGVFVLIGPAVVDAEACSSSTGCDDCVLSSVYWTWLCGTISRDAYCSCQQISGGCILGGSCDYTGSGGGDDCGPHGFCPENQNSLSASPGIDGRTTTTDVPTTTATASSVDAAGARHESGPPATPEKSSEAAAAAAAEEQQPTT